MSITAKAGHRHGLRNEHQANLISPLLEHSSMAGICLALFIAVDLFLVLSTGVVEYYPDIPLLTSFNLGVEHTIGVWWSTVTLLLASVLFYSGQHSSAKNRFAGILVAAIMAGLSLDELASIHERVADQGSWEYLLPFALVGGCMLMWALWHWMADPHTRPSALLLIAGFVCFGSVVGQEYLEHNVDWPAWSLGIRTGVEEGIELLGTLFCLFSALRLQRSITDESAQSTNPIAVLQRLPLLPDLFVLASLGLVLHGIASFIAPMLSGYPGRGNPAMWFPVCAWALVCLALLRRLVLTSIEQKQSHFLLGALLLMLTLLSIAHAVFVYPESSILKLVVRNSVVLALAVVALLALGLPVKRMLVISLPALLSLAWFFSGATTEAAFLVSGASAYAVLCGFFFLDRAQFVTANSELDSDQSVL